jgi:hypothetical protein
MKKFVLAAVLGLALFALPNAAEARPPGFYANGYAVNPFPYAPSAQGFNYYSSPYGYRTFNSYGTMATPFGFSNYNYGGTFVRPYSVGPMHSVYWNPFTNSYQYTTGSLNTPTFYNFGW